jgi:hypothetical protein
LAPARGAGNLIPAVGAGHLEPATGDGILPPATGCDVAMLIGEALTARRRPSAEHCGLT